MSTRTILLALLGAALLTSCYKQEAYDPLALSPNDVIVELRSSKDTLVANNHSTAMMTAFLPDGGLEGVDVTFRTDKGVFTGNELNTITVKTKAAILDNEVRIIAEARLRNGLSGGMFGVGASLGGYERVDSIYSKDNPPTGINIVVPALVLRNDSVSEMEFYAQILAESGTVSLGYDVVMEAIDPNQVARGTFRVAENESDAAGRCRYVFSMAPDWTYTGELTFRATSTAPLGTYQDSTIIYIIN